MPTFSFANTHAYPGCVVRIDPEPDARSGEALAEFSDGSVARCRYRAIDGAAMTVAIEPYVTARRTRIGAKSWTLTKDAASGTWKVTARI